MQFHHLGVACEDLDREAAAFAPLGYRADGDDFRDPVQGIKGRFLVGAGPRLELVAALNDRSTILSGILAQRIKLYHLAYSVPDMNAALEALRAQRGKVVVQPSPAVAFGGRDIAFLVMPNRVLVELIQAP
jgi:methylmalonyl-CoA/ethylmalonyl-CoA epimerase